MRIIAPNWIVEYLDIDTENITVAEFLFECAEKYNFAVKRKYWQGYNSFFIEAINGLENGKKGRYWQYLVNGEFADVGCSNYILHDNDVIEWQFERARWT